MFLRKQQREETNYGRSFKTPRLSIKHIIQISLALSPSLSRSALLARSLPRSSHSTQTHTHTPSTFNTEHCRSSYSYAPLCTSHNIYIICLNHRHRKAERRRASSGSSSKRASEDIEKSWCWMQCCVVSDLSGRRVANIISTTISYHVRARVNSKSFKRIRPTKKIQEQFCIIICNLKLLLLWSSLFKYRVNFNQTWIANRYLLWNETTLRYELFKQTIPTYL